MSHAPERVAVVGAGLIGSSWAALFWAAGARVAVYDANPAAEEAVRAAVARATPALQALGYPCAQGLEALSFHAKARDAVDGAAFIQESAPERIAIKHGLYREIEEALAPGAIVASSTSGLKLTEMQEGWRDPAPLLIGHPFNPPHLVPLVELYANVRTRPGALERSEEIYAALGKTTIRLKKEAVGHVANRLQAALWREAVHLVVSGVASARDVDTAISAGPGLRWAIMGPHATFDLGGGPGGMRVFCDRLGPNVETWWADLGAPRLDPETVEAISAELDADSSAEIRADRAAERDRKLIALMKALKSA